MELEAGAAHVHRLLNTSVAGVGQSQLDMLDYATDPWRGAEIRGRVPTADGAIVRFDLLQNALVQRRAIQIRNGSLRDHQPAFLSRMDNRDRKWAGTPVVHQ